MSRIRDFIKSRSAARPAPAFFVLTRIDDLDTYRVHTVEATDLMSGGQALEKALREDLSTVPVGQSATYTIAADGAGGESMGSQKLICRGTGNEETKGAVGRTGAIDGHLVKLVQSVLEDQARMTGTLFDRQEKTIAAQAGTINKLTDSIQELADRVVDASFNVASGSGDDDNGPNPIAAMAGQRLRQLIDTGVGVAVARLGSGQQTAPAESDDADGGKYVPLREFIALRLTDEEIEKIMKVVIEGGMLSSLQECLTPESMGALMTIMGG